MIIFLVIYNKKLNMQNFVMPINKEIKYKKKKVSSPVHMEEFVLSLNVQQKQALLKILSTPSEPAAEPESGVAMPAPAAEPESSVAVPAPAAELESKHESGVAVQDSAAEPESISVTYAQVNKAWCYFQQHGYAFVGPVIKSNGTPIRMFLAPFQGGVSTQDIKEAGVLMIPQKSIIQAVSHHKTTGFVTYVLGVSFELDGVVFGLRIATTQSRTTRYNAAHHPTLSDYITEFPPLQQAANAPRNTNGPRRDAAKANRPQRDEAKRHRHGSRYAAFNQ